MSILKERVTLPVSFPITCCPGAREITMGGAEWAKERRGGNKRRGEESKERVTKLFPAEYV